MTQSLQAIGLAYGPDPTQNIVGFNYSFTKAILGKLVDMYDRNTLEKSSQERWDRLTNDSLGHALIKHLVNQTHIDITGYDAESMNAFVRSINEFLAIFENK